MCGRLITLCVLLWMAGPAAAEMSQSSGTLSVTSETNFDGTGSYAGVSETVNNIYGPSICRVEGQFRPARPEEMRCAVEHYGVQFFNVESQCEVDSLDYPVTVTIDDAVLCIPHSCLELDTTHNIVLVRVGCQTSSSYTGRIVGEDLTGEVSGQDLTRYTAVRVDADRRVIVGRTESTSTGMADIDFTSGEPPARGAVIESPAEGSTVSGVSNIRGWSCLGGDLKAEFSDENGVTSTFALPHGVPRGDTESVCGDSDNGFSTTMNWALLGPGPKTMRLIQNGEVQGEPRNFSVVAFAEEFIRGASARVTVEDFPDTGQSVVVEWSEPEQRFVITQINN